MELIVKEHEFDYNDELQEKTFNGIQPMLDYSLCDYSCDYNNGRLLTTRLVNSLFYDYKHFVLDNNLKDSYLTKKVRVTSVSQFLEFFRHYMIGCNNEQRELILSKKGDHINGYKVYVYPNTVNEAMYTDPTAKYAMYSNLCIRNNIVYYSYNNVCKNYDWDELLEMLCGLDICGFTDEAKQAENVSDINKYSFVLITDNECTQGVTNIFNVTLAGCLTNHKTNTKTIFNKPLAITLYASLHMLCQKFMDEYEEWDNTQGDSVDTDSESYKEAMAEINDSIEEHNPYVEKFNEICEMFENAEDASTLFNNVW